MIVIPAVNERSFDETKQRLKEAIDLVRDLPEEERWVHIDVTDGTFTDNSFWHDVGEFPVLKQMAINHGVKIEIHLMIGKPEWALGEWLKAGADRIIIHYEALEFQQNIMLFGGAVALAINPDTPAEAVATTAEYTNRILLLGVTPGLSGQSFDDSTLAKIKFLRQHLPNATISVDGGVNYETGKMCKDAGAHLLISASYVWNNDVPRDAFQKLRAL